MRVKIAAFSNLGPRKVNEDRYLKPEPASADALLVAIADGMGGAPGGADAASIAIDVARATDPEPERLEQMFADTVSALWSRSTIAPELGRMGTTLSLAVLTADSVHVAHVGDTRIYHLRGAGLNNLTEDQTEIAELIRRGVFSERQTKRYRRRNVLLTALTTAGEYSVYRAKAELEVGDHLALLSDGVHQRVMRGGILNSSIAHPVLKDFVYDIERRVVASTPTNNFTVLAVQIKEL